VHVGPAHRRRGIGSWLLGETGDWLRLARVSRLLDYCASDDAWYREFLDAQGFRLLTRPARRWELR
jgi:GNAT superfamily N-acetyltransferase